MRERNIIGLCGLAGSGKSTAARLLSRELNFARRPFAYKLKAMLSALGVDKEILDGSRESKEVPLECLGGITARHAMQTLGTEWGRNCMRDDFWIIQWMREIHRFTNVVADDVRFPNEADLIRSLGGRVYKIERAGSGDRINPGHASEAIHLIRVDGVIENNGSEADLLASLREVVEGVPA